MARLYNIFSFKNGSIKWICISIAMISYLHLLTGCKEEQQHLRSRETGKTNLGVCSETLLTIPLYLTGKKPHQTSISFSDLLDELSITELETSQQSSLASVEKLFLHENKFIIVDTKYHQVKVFDQTGNYLYDIGSIGKGPGQFLNVSDANFTDGLIELYSIESSLLLYYKPDGSFVASKRVPFLG